MKTIDENKFNLEELSEDVFKKPFKEVFSETEILVRKATGSFRRIFLPLAIVCFIAFSVFMFNLSYNTAHQNEIEMKNLVAEYESISDDLKYEIILASEIREKYGEDISRIYKVVATLPDEKRKDFLNDVNLLAIGLVASKSETVSTAQGVPASDYDYVGFSQKAHKPIKIESALTGEEIEVYSKEQVDLMKLRMDLKRAVSAEMDAFTKTYK